MVFEAFNIHSFENGKSFRLIVLQILVENTFANRFIYNEEVWDVE